MTELDSITPDRAVELYLDTRREELADSTYRSQKCRLQRFAEWCCERDIDDLTDLRGRDLQAYRVYLRDHYERRDGDTGVSVLTIRTRLATIRVFLRFCVSIDAVAPTFPEKIVLPTVDRDKRFREEIIDHDVATEVLEKLRENRYASNFHVAFLLCWSTGCRLGTVRGFDVGDVDYDNERIDVRHRPESDTPLKNEDSAERILALPSSVLSVLREYERMNRVPNTDEYGREPLLTTEHGRPDKSTVRAWIYKAQLPCYYDNSCPHGREIPDCDHKYTYNRKDCPSTTMPHNIRRGRITQLLAEDVPKRAVSDRVDVAGDVLSTHYDQRSEAGKAEQRRDYFT